MYNVFLQLQKHCPGYKKSLLQVTVSQLTLLRDSTVNTGSSALRITSTFAFSHTATVSLDVTKTAVASWSDSAHKKQEQKTI